MRLIPAIDLKGSRCVRLHQGAFDRETHYSDDPLAVARAFRDQGFEVLHVVDLDGARSGEQRHAALVTEIVAATGFEVQLGGGIRDPQTVQRWLDAGVARCVVGSVAVTAPDRTADWMARFGAERIVAAFDVRTGEGEPVPAIHGWTEAAPTTLSACVERLLGHGLVHLLCTDVGRDGALTGPNLELYRGILARWPGIALQASGGIRHAADLAALRDIGCPAAISGRALLDGRITNEEIEPFLRDA